MMLSYQYLAAYLRARATTERGASLVEYALLTALIALVCVAAVTALGKTTNSKFDSVSSGL